MAANHLEQLVAEWYEYRGYFVRRNVKVGKRAKGGYEGELDIVALNPQQRHLVHLETSLDAESWDKRETRFKRKFLAGQNHIPSLFSGMDIPTDIEQVAVLLFASKANRETLGGGRLLLVSELLEEIFATLRSTSVYLNMVDEQKPLLRTLQFVAEYKANVVRALTRP